MDITSGFDYGTFNNNRVFGKIDEAFRELNGRERGT